MSFVITSLAELSGQTRTSALQRAEAIFFETSTTTHFDSEAIRAAFRARWFARYAELYPEAFLIGRIDGEVVGYLSGCLESFAEKAKPIVKDIFYYTPAFCKALSKHPAHFHINIDPSRHGQGLGRALVAEFLRLVEAGGQSGVHVVTGADTPPVLFYEACGFRAAAPVEGISPRLAIMVYD